MEKKDEKSKPHIGIVNLERRRHPRFKINLPLEYYRVDSPANYSARALNAGEGGLEVYFPEEMKINQHLRLKLFFSLGSQLNVIEVLAEVVWTEIHLGEEGEEHRSGVRFIDISSEDLDRLKSFLRSLVQ